MSRSFDADDPTALGETFAEDLSSAFPEAELPERVVQDHVAAMISAAHLLVEEGATVLEPASHPAPERLTTPRRRWMRTRLIKRVVAVASGLVLSLGGLAIAGAFEGSDDPGNDDTTAIVSHQTDDDQGEDADDQGEDENADDQGENNDDQGENADDQGENADDQGEEADDQGEEADDQGEGQDDQGEDADDQGEDENADDQGENNDDQGEDENADDQGENNDDQGEDGDDQGDNDNTNDDQGDNENVDDDQGDGGDSQD